MPRPRPASRAAWSLAWVLPALLAILGCGGMKNHTFLAHPRITEIHLLAMPIGLNLDQSPGADGFAVKIYAVSSDDPKSQIIRKGSLEILMYDGDILGTAMTNAPSATWSYSADQLIAFQFQSTIGAAYAFTPVWGTNSPHMSKITVRARYSPVDGAPILSAASPIMVVSQ